MACIIFLLAHVICKVYMKWRVDRIQNLTIFFSGSGQESGCPEPQMIISYSCVICVGIMKIA